jgi:DNA-directed RNA polymerase specialized sigma24 family protein
LIESGGAPSLPRCLRRQSPANLRYFPYINDGLCRYDCVVIPPESQPLTLGDLLYANKGQALVSEQTWVGLVRSIAARDRRALHALYTQTYSVVFTWITQSVSNWEVAEDLTLDVFHDVWRTAATYDPVSRSVVGWVMNKARSRAIGRLQFGRPLLPTTIDLVSSPADLLRPPASRWELLARRIAAETGDEPLLPTPERRAEPEWCEVAPGIACKLLATDTEHDRVSMLVWLAPGVPYPPHRHAGADDRGPKALSGGLQPCRARDWRSICLERDRLHVRARHIRARRTRKSASRNDRRTSCAHPRQAPGRPSAVPDSEILGRSR